MLENINIPATIHDLLPNAKYTNSYSYETLKNTWYDSRQIPTEKEIKDCWDSKVKKKIDNDLIINNRRKNYPQIGDQLDAILKYLQAGGITPNENGTDLEKIIYNWQDVKNKNPKIV